MRIRRTAPALVIASLAALTAAAACGPAPTAATPSAPPTTGRRPAVSAPAQDQDRTTAGLPDLVGKGLQSAQDAAQAAGFDHLRSHDALGRRRHQILDRDWKVCTQTPGAGSRPTDVTVDLGAVKLDESCPAHDEGTATPKAGSTMPDFIGKALSTATDALDPSTSIDVKDASGRHRMVLIQSNWQVCTQDPRPGTAITGQPVTFTVVKFGERCP